MFLKSIILLTLQPKSSKINDNIYTLICGYFNVVSVLDKGFSKFILKHDCNLDFKNIKIKIFKVYGMRDFCKFILITIKR